MSVETLTPTLPRAARAGVRDWRRSPELVAVASLTILAAVLRFVAIGHQGFWFDEANTALLVHFSPGKMLGLIPQTESTPPLYYMLAWVWARLFGYTEAPLRSLSALAGVLTVPVAYAAAAKLVSQRAGVIAAALTASNPLLIWYSQEARSYELLVLLSSASLLAFAYAHARPTPRSLAAWVAASALALATHYYALLAVVPQALWLLAVHYRRRRVQVALALVALCGAGLLRLAVSQSATGKSSWIHHAPLGRRMAQLVPQFVSGFAAPGYSVLEPLALACAVIGLLLVLLRAAPRERRGAVIAASLAVTGLALNLLLVAAGVDDLLTRNLLALWMPVAVAVAGGLAAVRAQPLGWAAAVVLCATGLAATIGVGRDRDYQRPDWRVVAATLDRPPAHSATSRVAATAGLPARAGRPAPLRPRVVLIQHYRDLLPLSLYLPRLQALPAGGARVRELDVVSFTSPPSNGFCWWGSACNLWPSVMQRHYPISGFHAVSRSRELQFTILRLISARPEPVTYARVAQALHTTRITSDELLLQR